MKKHFDDIKHIYMFAFGILSIIFVFTVSLPRISPEGAIRYYFFLANRYKDTYRYIGERLEIKAEPKGHQERPAYIFKNRLLFLYYGYVVRLKKTFSPEYKLSFDIYPEQSFLKIYPLDGKIISFRIDLLRSPRGVHALEYELDLSNRNRCMAGFTLKSADGETIDITDKEFKREFFIPHIHKMHLKIISRRGDITLYINGQLISRGLVKDDVEAGLFNLVKFAGSQFQMDNLRITNFKTGEDVEKEDFNKYINFFDIKEWFSPHQRVFFIIMLFTLAAFGYVFDICLVFFSRLFGPEALWMKFIVPQVLFLFTINRFCSLSMEPGLYAAFSIVGAKIIYSGIHFLKRNTQAK